MLPRLEKIATRTSSVPVCAIFSTSISPPATIVRSVSINKAFVIRMDPGEARTRGLELLLGLIESSDASMFSKRTMSCV